MDMSNSNNNLARLLFNLTTVSNSQVYHSLIKIRQKFCNTDAGLSAFSDNALNILINFLNSSNEKVVDVTLSILGICCLKDERVINKVSGLCVEKPLMQVLSNMKRDCIVCRCCRLVGNLAQVNRVGAKMLKQGVALHLIYIALNDSGEEYSSNTLVMALRALRLLWNVSSYREEMLSSGLVRATSQYLNIVKNSEKLVESALKTMSVICVRPSAACASSIKECATHLLLMDLTKEDKFRYSAVKCICNLCWSSVLRPELGNAGVVTFFISDVRDSLAADTINSELSLYMIHCLCLLSRESVNRAKVRREEGLSLFTELLRRCKLSDRMLLPSLLSYIYDDSSLEKLISAGIVDVLGDLLSDYVVRFGSPHAFKHCTNTDNDQTSAQSRSDDVWSDSGISTSLEEELEEVEMYTNNEQELEEVEMYTNNEQEPYEEDSGNDLDQEQCCRNAPVINKYNEDRYERSVAALLILLSKISQMDVDVEQLPSRKIFVSLIDYITLVNASKSRAIQVLKCLVRKHSYLLPLIRSHFVLEVQSRLISTPHTGCSACYAHTNLGQNLLLDFRVVAQSGFGEGEISHHFLTSKEEIRRMITVTLPYIISDESYPLMKKILLEQCGLDLLISTLKNIEQEGDVISLCSVDSVVRLSKTLKIVDPTTFHHREYVSLPFSSPEVTESEVQHIQSCNNISFVLDDGTMMSTLKLPLAQYSPVFNTMFFGNFKESGADVVSLPGVSRKALSCILMMVKGDDLSLFENLSVEDILDILQALDRFLLPGAESLVKLLVSSKLVPDTAVRTYSCCVTLNSLPCFEFIRLCVVQYMLAGEMTPQQRRRMFITAVQSSYADLLLDDMKSVLSTKLENVRHRNVGKCS